jgi:type I restriction enzyme, S subunit
VRVAAWPVKRMDELCEITSSKRIFAADYVSDGVPFYRGREITEKYKGNLDVSTELFITEEKFREIERKFGAPKLGDLLLTSVGTLGSVYVVKPGERFYFKDGNLTWFRHFKGLDSQFLYYWIGSPQGKGELQKCTIGSSQSAFTIVLLKSMEIELPPLPVQQRIAGILSAYDELIENSQRRIKILESMARALYREWFVHFRFPGHEHHPRVAYPLGEIPQGWEAIAFTEIADVLSGGTPKTSTPEYWDGEIPFFTPRDAPDCFYVQDADKHVTELGLSKCASQLYPPDTVFITARGTVGKVAIPSVPMAMNQSCYALRGKSGISQRFLFLMTLQQVEYLKTNTGGATFDTIVVDTFRRMQIAKPPHDLIAAFTRNVDAVFEQVNTLQRQVRNLRRTRDLLLPRLLSGQIPLGMEKSGT